eukprot:5430042-Prymnesium_polylepis.1
MTVWAAERGLRRPLGPSARLKRRHGEVERPHRRCFGRAASAQWPHCDPSSVVDENDARSG